jgi:long-chain acyl-CoA synthetase
MNKIVFLTGATGLVGGNLIPRILKDHSITRLVLLIRGGSDREAELRVDQMLEAVTPEIDKDQAKRCIQVVRGDITLDRLGLSENLYNSLAKEVTHIIHSAATVQFQLPLECASLINCTGTKNVMTLAQCAQKTGRLKGVAYVSTAYVSGDLGGRILETELDCGQQFSNTYERTKLESEKIVRQLMNELPITIFRPSIIVGDSKTGRTTAFNVLYPPLKLIYHNLIHILPGSSHLPLDIVPVDFVTDAIDHISLKTNQGISNTYHLTAGEKHSTTTGEVVDLAIEYFNKTKTAGFLQRIQFMPLEQYRLVKESLRVHEKRVWQMMETYKPYLCVKRIFDNSNTLSSLRGTSITVPDFKAYCQAIFGYSLQADWGKRLKNVA